MVFPKLTQDAQNHQKLDKNPPPPPLPPPSGSHPPPATRPEALKNRPNGKKCS